MTSTSDRGTDLVQELRQRAHSEGFDAFGIMRPADLPDLAAHYQSFVDQGWHGDMGWMADNLDRRTSPTGLWPDVRSVIVLGMNYGPDDDPLALRKASNKGVISCYARNRDYHDVIKKRIRRIARWLAETTGQDVKIFVDTAPVPEKALAQTAGLGWQGKHTNLVSRDLGSWLFLASIYTETDLPTDQPDRDHCGSCRNCLDVCPTDAFPAPYQLDARKCISYLTIEHKGPIPHDLRSKMGNRIYGCDDCLAVCPWNKFAQTGREAAFHARDSLASPDLADLAGLDDAAFRQLFTASPIKRIGRDRFVRNVLVALGNSGEAANAKCVEALLSDESALVRGAAVWALAQLLAEEEFAAIRGRLQGQETETQVLAEWQQVQQMPQQ